MQVKTIEGLLAKLRQPVHINFIAERILRKEMWETKEILNEESKYEDEFKSVGYDSFEEYLCDSFVDFIHRMKIEEGLTEDLDDERKIKNYKSFDYYFKSIF